MAVVGVARVLVEAEQHGDEHAEQHGDVLEAHQRAEAEDIGGEQRDGDEGRMIMGPAISSTSAMTTGRAAEVAGRQGDRGRSLFTFRDG